MNNNIYDQGREENFEANQLRRETGKNRKYFLEDSDLERKSRLEQSKHNREGSESVVYSQHNSQNQKKQKKVLSKKGKKFIKRAIPTAGMIGLIIAGTNATMAKIEKYKEQKSIDKSISDDYNGYIQDLSEKENVTFTSKSLDKTKEFYAAIETYKNSDDITAKTKAKATIVEYMDRGYFEHTAEVAINRKIEEAVLYGDYDKDNNNPVEVMFINGTDGESDILRIKGIDGKYYSMNGLDVWSEDIPDNLKQLAEDVFELQDNSNWKSEDKCIKDAIEMSEHLGVVVQEHYILNDKADIERVSDKEYEVAKNNYEEKINKQEQNLSNEIREKYGKIMYNEEIDR